MEDGDSSIFHFHSQFSVSTRVIPRSPKATRNLSLGLQVKGSKEKR